MSTAVAETFQQLSFEWIECPSNYAEPMCCEVGRNDSVSIRSRRSMSDAQVKLTESPIPADSAIHSTAAKIKLQPSIVRSRAKSTTTSAPTVHGETRIGDVRHISGLMAAVLARYGIDAYDYAQIQPPTEPTFG